MSGAHDAPVSLTMGFAPRHLGSFKRRACHQPSTCEPASTKLFSGGCTSQTCVVGGSATLTGGPGLGGISLVSMDNPQERQIGSAFSSAHARLLEVELEQRVERSS